MNNQAGEESETNLEPGLDLRQTVVLFSDAATALRSGESEFRFTHVTYWYMRHDTFYG